VDEFEWIERCLKPLARGAPEALGLVDDAAAIPSRPGHDLVISKDAMVEGVHFLASDPMEDVARKLLRINLSDLAAKGAEPYGYFLATAWPADRDWAQRAAFARGLADDQRRYGLSLFGGDTVSTPGPLTLSLTILGWTSAGRMVRRGGARPGDVVLVTGVIGDGALGLEAALGRLDQLDPADQAALALRYRLPQPRTAAAALLRDAAHAAADVSDGLIADAGRIAEASGVALRLDLERTPLSAPARRWLERQPDRREALAWLCAGGDDYEVLCTAPAEAAAPLIASAGDRGIDMTVIGQVTAGAGAQTALDGQVFKPARSGYRHG
jgi:thiamine-monophosphate kinase